jgi:hypothetical protein
MSHVRCLPMSAAFADHVRHTREDGHGSTGLVELPAGKGSPCRVCLEDAAISEPVLLFSYAPWTAAAPHRVTGPIFIHARSCTPYPGVALPPVMQRRQVALRAYDRSGARISCVLAEGAAIEEHLGTQLADAGVEFVDVYNARAGCFSCRVVRRA